MKLKVCIIILCVLSAFSAHFPSTVNWELSGSPLYPTSVSVYKYGVGMKYGVRVMGQSFMSVGACASLGIDSESVGLWLDFSPGWSFIKDQSFYFSLGVCGTYAFGEHHVWRVFICPLVYLSKSSRVFLLVGVSFMF